MGAAGNGGCGSSVVSDGDGGVKIAEGARSGGVGQAEWAVVAEGMKVAEVGRIGMRAARVGRSSGGGCSGMGGGSGGCWW